MPDQDLVIVEIIYKDAISRNLKRAIGKVNRSEIDYFNEHESSFIMPLGHTGSPISKERIIEIIIYRESERIPCHKEKLIRNQQIISRKEVSISH